MTKDASANCAHCGERAGIADRFCESCGSPLATGSALLDHRETDLGLVAAVSDRGLQRGRNEDYYAIDAGDGGLLAVVCDGVATSEHAGPAAAAAARAALGRMTAGASAMTDWSALAWEAVAAAQEAVVPKTGPAITADGSTTLTLALVRTGEIVVANVGDSRAYWIGEDGRNALLSVDDSWENYAGTAGFPESVARDPSRRHEITAWLGPDADLISPHVARHHPHGKGLLVLCSDGLWNYTDSPDALARLVSQSGDKRPAGVARHLVQAAIAAGGADNVTVAVVAHSRPDETATDQEGKEGVDDDQL
jgi:serine/threonine protein phosphatase PrpC